MFNKITISPRIRRSALIVFSLLVVLFLAIPPIIVYSGKYRIYREIEDVYPMEVGIVFGAGVRPDGSPTPMLKDRLLTAQDLLEGGKIETILLSGDNSTTHYNEPQAMFTYLVEQGVPEDAMVMDLAGRRTYDTCYRAKEIFSVEKAILITQGYHLPRALYLCSTFGITSTGFSATQREYVGELYYKLREVLALYNSVLDILIIHPTPILGEKIPI